MGPFNQRKFFKWLGILLFLLCCMQVPAYSQSKKSDTKGAKKGKENAVKSVPDSKRARKNAGVKKEKHPGGRVKKDRESKRNSAKDKKPGIEVRKSKKDRPLKDGDAPKIKGGGRSSGSIDKNSVPTVPGGKREKGLSKEIPGRKVKIPTAGGRETGSDTSKDKKLRERNPPPRRGRAVSQSKEQKKLHTVPAGKREKGMTQEIPGRKVKIPTVGGRETGSVTSKDQKLRDRTPPPRRGRPISQYEEQKKLHTQRVPGRRNEQALPKENPVEWKMKPERNGTKLDKDLKNYQGEMKMPTVPRQRQLGRRHSKEILNYSGKLSIAKAANDRKQYFRLSRKTSLYTGDLRIKWTHFHHRHPSLWRMGRNERPSSAAVYKNRKMPKKPKYDPKERSLWQKSRPVNNAPKAASGSEGGG